MVFFWNGEEKRRRPQRRRTDSQQRTHEEAEEPTLEVLRGQDIEQFLVDGRIEEAIELPFLEQVQKCRLVLENVDARRLLGLKRNEVVVCQREQLQFENKARIGIVHDDVGQQRELLLAGETRKDRGILRQEFRCVEGCHHLEIMLVRIFT